MAESAALAGEERARAAGDARVADAEARGRSMAAAADEERRHAAAELAALQREFRAYQVRNGGGLLCPTASSCHFFPGKLGDMGLASEGRGCGECLRCKLL